MADIVQSRGGHTSALIEKDDHNARNGVLRIV